MKKFFIPFLVLTVVLTFAQLGFALSLPLQTPRDKQLLADGDMETSGTAAWGSYQSTLSKQTTSPHGGRQVIRVTYSVSNMGLAYQAVLTVGKRYRLTGWMRGDGTSAPVVFLGTTAYQYGTNSTSWQRIDVTGVATGDTQLRLRSNDLASGTYVEYDDIMVTEYVGYAQNSEKQLLVDGDMESVGFDAWTIGNVTGSKETGTPKGGKQVLRIAHNGVNSSGSAAQNILTVSKKYKVTGWARNAGLGEYPAIIASGAFQWSGTTGTGWQRIDFVFTQTSGASISFSGYSLSAGSYIEWDDISVSEYKGGVVNSEKQLLADGDMEATGTTSWTAVGGGVITKETAGTPGGARHIRVTTATSGNPQANQAILTTGRRYKVTGKIKNHGAAYATVNTGVSVNAYISTLADTWEKFSVTSVASGSNQLILVCAGVTAPNYCEWDDLFVTLLP